MFKTIQQKLNDAHILDKEEPILSFIKVVDYQKHQQLFKKILKEELNHVLPSNKSYYLLVTSNLKFNSIGRDFIYFIIPLFLIVNLQLFEPANTWSKTLRNEPLGRIFPFHIILVLGTLGPQSQFNLLKIKFLYLLFLLILIFFIKSQNYFKRLNAHNLFAQV